MDVTDSSKFLVENEDMASWREKHAFCYEIYVPLTTSKKVWRRWMADDLNRWFGLNGRVEERNVRCLALVRTNKDNSKWETQGGKRRRKMFAPVGL